MNFRFKNIFLFFLILIISSCSKEIDRVRTIKFWAMGSEAEQISKIIPEFEKRYPDLKVKVQQIPMDSSTGKLITAFD